MTGYTFQELQKMGATHPTTPTPTGGLTFGQFQTPPPPKPKSLFQNIGSDIQASAKEQTQNVITGLNRQIAGQQGDVQTGLQTVGAGAGLIKGAASSIFKRTGMDKVTDVVKNKLLEQIPGYTQAIQAKDVIANLPLVKQSWSTIKDKLGAVFNDIAQKHPAAIADIEALMNVGEVVGTAAMGVEAVGMVKGVAREMPGVAEKELKSLAEETMGVSDKKARISSLEQTGAKTKTGEPIGGVKQTLLGGIKQETTEADLLRAKDVKGIVKVGASPVDNLTNLNKEISRISEKEVAPSLEKVGANKPTDVTKINERLSKIEKPDIIKSDATLDKTYELVRNRMIEQIKKFPPTLKGLWDARKEFDKVIEEQFGDVAFDSEKNTAIKRAVKDMRRDVNDIIGEVDPTFKPQMDKLSNLYDARYNLAEQFQNLVDKGGWKAFIRLNPTKARLLKWGAGGVGYETAKHTIAPILPGF